MTIRWSETAIANLEQLHDYIADRNPDAAQAAAERIIAAVASLERFPYMDRVGRAPETRILEAVDAVRAGIEAFAETIETSAVYPIPDDQIIHNVAVLQAIIRSAATRMPEVVG